MSDALEWLDRTLANCPSGGCALYIRHASRDSQATMSEHIGQVLHPTDRALAIEFGGRLKGRLGDVVTASRDRSMHTAKCILAGADSATQEPVTDPDIGDPSAYIADEEALLAQCEGLPPDTARQELLTGILRQTAPWATMDPKGAARRIQEKIIARIRPGKIAVFVAPSVAIAATAALALERENSMWHLDCPLSLEGAVFFRSDDGGVWLSMGSYSGRSVL